MKQKHFILALVAMLSFAFSAFAQTTVTVTTEAELRTAMSSAGAVTLGGDIELDAAIVIPKKIAIVLDLNGHRIEGVTTGQNGISLESNASLTINDSKGGGLITSKSYVLNGAGGSKIILNAGKIYRSSWAVYTTGSFVINGGTVECNDGSMAIRVAGSGTITLNGGTVTSVQVSGGTLNVQNEDATITSGIQLDKGAKDVNITAGTIEGNITVAPEVTADKITISGGTIQDGDAVKDYLEEGKSLDVNGNVVQSKVTVAKVGDVEYSDIQEAIKAAAPAGTVDVLADVTVDKWVMFAEKMTIGDGSLITLNINGLTINGNNNTLTVKSIESAGNGGYLFYDAQNLTVKDLTINIADGLVGGIGLQQGTISNVTFNGGQYGVLPGKNGVTVTGCTFNDTKGYAVYYEDERPGIVVTGNTFNTADDKYAITMRSNEQFTNNTVVKGRVNLANSAASTVTGNDFGTERFKVYNDATATISDNKINNLVFNETTAPAASTFTADNTLSAEAQAAIEALPVMAGDGTEANPYTIGNLTQLKAFRDDVNAGNNYQGKFVELTADIDLNNEEWTPIAKFNGVFDGNDKTISNLVVNGEGKSDQGFFGNTNNGEIKNLTINNAKVTGRLNVGVVAGTPYTSKYTNIKVTGHVEVNGMAYVGGVGGKNAYANWTDITVDVDNDSYVKATSTEDGTAYRTYVGGVIGFNGEGGHTFKNISSNIKVIGDVCDIGGIFGILHYGNKVETVTFAGQVEAPAGAKEVGAIAGVWHNQVGQSVTINNATIADGSTVKVGDVTTTGSIVGGAYNAANQSPETSGSLKVDGKEVWVGLAKVGEVPYETLKAAVDAAQPGETITLLADIEATEVILLDKSVTINGNGHKVTSNATRVFRVTTANTEVTLNDVKMVSTAVRVGTNDVRGISIDIVDNVKLTLNNSSVDFTDASANDWAYAVNVTGGNNHVVTVNGGAYEGANVINVNGANNTVTVKDAVITCTYPNNAQYYGACIWVLQNQGSSVEATGNTFNGSNAIAFNLGTGTVLTESDNTDNTGYVVAMIGDAYYTSIQAAVEAAQNGETIKLTQNVKMDTKQYVTQNDGYAVLVNVADKDVTIDLNGKTVTVNANAADLDGAAGKMLMAVFHADPNSSLTLTDNSEAKTGKVDVKANDATIYSFGASESKKGTEKATNGTLTIASGTYTIDNVANSMFFTDANAKIVIDGGNFTLGNVGSGSNGSPWIFNTLGSNEINVIVNGGTFNADVNHQYWAHEVDVAKEKALQANGDGTWTVVPAVAYVVENNQNYDRNVGYATIEEAIVAVEENKTITLVKDITYTKDNADVNGEYVDGFVYTGDKSFTIDFNGKTITENGDINDYLVYLKNAGEKDNEITFKNGTIAVAESTAAWAAITVGANSATCKTTLNLEGMKVVNGNPNDANNQVIRIRKGSVVNLNEGTEVTSNGTSYGVAAETTATVNINKGAKVVQTNSKTTGGNLVYTAVSGNGTINVYDGAEIESDNYGIHNMTSGNTVINIYGGSITAKVAVHTATNGDNGESAVANISGGTFKGKLEAANDDASIVVSGGTFDQAVDEKYVATGYICKDNGDGTFGVVVNPEYGKIAQIGNGSVFENQYFATLNDAAQAAKTDDVIKLIADVNISAAGYATVDETDKYSTMMAVKEKDITLDMNGKTITVTPTADELADAEMQMLMSVFGMDTNGKLTITGNGSVKVVANGANVYSIATAYGEGSQITIENGNFEVDKLMLSGSVLYSQQSECIIVNGGNFKLGNLADSEGQNGQPWIFNTKGQNYTGAIVNGGTFPTDINHQFWAHEVRVPETKALKANEDGTWTVVPSVAYTSEKATSRGSYFRNVGYASIEEAIAATGKYNCDDNIVTLVKDVEIEKMITVANGTTVVLDLAGKTLAAIDNTTKNYSAIDNRGDLTIRDFSEEGSGKMTVTATVNNGWDRYSAVIANNPGGKLTVESGTLEHLGGTDMAYGIDNLTNGKGTYAETEITGGVVKSPYRAVRQFLNGVEAENILTINGGTVEGANKSIFFHDPSENANTGTLNIGEDAVIKGDIYLFVTENSTAWPVDVYVAKEALEGESTIISKNVPATYHVLEYPAYWTVECDVLEELTIVDGEDAEYINLIQKSVGTLTYDRYFEDDKWQTLYLPFEVPVADLMNEFEFAYIYNASNKNGEGVKIDYVVIEDTETVLAANYPYLIRAKEAGWNNIVVTDATLMPTEENTIDCSSVFETFTFKGNYSTIKLSEDYTLEGGAWKNASTLNPFRFYLQIESRGTNNTTVKKEAIVLRRVTANGNPTGIEGVESDQNEGVDYIFDLHGRRVTEPQKGGIYIVNGKKILF